MMIEVVTLRSKHTRQPQNIEINVRIRERDEKAAKTNTIFLQHLISQNNGRERERKRAREREMLRTIGSRQQGDAYNFKCITYSIIIKRQQH